MYAIRLESLFLNGISKMRISILAIQLCKIGAACLEVTYKMVAHCLKNRSRASVKSLGDKNE